MWSVATVIAIGDRIRRSGPQYEFRSKYRTFSVSNKWTLIRPVDEFQNWAATQQGEGPIPASLLAPVILGAYVGTAATWPRTAEKQMD